MNKKNKKSIYNVVLLGLLFLTPLKVLALEENIESLAGIFLTEAFVSIHMAIFFQYPFSKIINPYDNMPLFLKLFFGRIIFLLIFDIFITPGIVIFDFLFVFFGAFIIVPITYYFRKREINFYELKRNIQGQFSSNSIIYKCKNCNKKININDDVCKNCKTPIENKNIIVEKIKLKAKGIDIKYFKRPNAILKECIKEEIMHKNITYHKIKNRDLIMKKNILCLIFILLSVINILAFLFYIPLKYSVLTEILLLIIFTYKYINENMINYIAKVCRKNPNEKIIDAINDFISNENPKAISPLLKYTTIFLILCVLIIYKFNNPVLIYKKVDNSYYIVKCSKSLKNNNVLKVPSKYKNKQVIGLSPRSFSNTNIEIIELEKGIRHIDEKAFYNNHYLRKINIPSTIIEIRKEAFKNNTNLEEVNISYGIKNIASGTFENCHNLSIIEIPKSVENIGTNAFLNCEKLDKEYEENANYEGE